MTIQETAGRLVELCRKGDFETAQKELYAQEVISVEPYATPDFEKETTGSKQVYAKLEKFNTMVDEMHSIHATEPILADSSFAFVLTMDLTMKGKGRSKMSELCVYEVKNGKVVKEQFFV